MFPMTDFTAAAAVLLPILLLEFFYYTGRQIAGRSRDETGDMTPHQMPDNGDPSPAAVSDRSGTSIRKWIITHTDFDGLTSGALLLRLLKQNSGLLFSSPASLLKVMEKASRSMIRGDTIHIADLALQPHREHDFSDLLADLQSRGIDVVWIDHHEWPAELTNRIRHLCRELIVDTSEKTAAALIRRLMPPDDQHADRLIRFVQNRVPDAEKEWCQRWRLVLAELSHQRDPELNETVLRTWAADEPIGVLISSLARKGKQREEATRKIASDMHRREITAHQRSFLVIDVRRRRLERDSAGRLLYVIGGPRPSMMVGLEACRMHHGDFCLIVWDDFRYSVYRGLDTQLELTPLFGRRDIGSSTFMTGGHKYAVSVRVLPTLGSRLMALIRWRLGPDAERFIDLLKEKF